MFKRIVVLLFVLIVTSIALSAQEEMMGDPMVRFSHLAPDAGSVNIYVNEELFAGMDGEPARYDPGIVYTYLPFPSGTYTVSVVPEDGAMEEAFIDSVELTVEEGHRYNALLYGQVADESLSLLLLDETVAMQQYEVEEAVAPVILFQGISEIPAVDIYAGGALFLENIEFGDIRIIDFPLSIVPITITVHGDPDTIVLEEDFFGVPNTLALAALFGSFPENYGRVITNTTDLSAFEFFVGAADSPIMSFNTLLAAVGALAEAGVDLPDSEPNSTFFAPTDAAFAALPDGTLDALIADPELLARVLLYHGVQGPLYIGDVLDAIMESGAVNVETALGEDFVVTATEDGLFINDDVQIIYADIQVSDGIIHVINGVLMPPEE